MLDSPGLPVFCLSLHEYFQIVSAGLSNIGVEQSAHGKLIERMFPAGTNDVLSMLRARGYAATQADVEQFARGYPFRHVGKSRLWWPSDLEDFARTLAERGRFTAAAIARRDAGQTGADAVAGPGLTAIVEEFLRERHLSPVSAN